MQFWVSFRLLWVSVSIPFTLRTPFPESTSHAQCRRRQEMFSVYLSSPMLFHEVHAKEIPVETLHRIPTCADRLRCPCRLRRYSSCRFAWKSFLGAIQKRVRLDPERRRVEIPQASGRDKPLG